MIGFIIVGIIACIVAICLIWNQDKEIKRFHAKFNHEVELFKKEIDEQVRASLFSERNCE